MRSLTFMHDGRRFLTTDRPDADPVGAYVDDAGAVHLIKRASVYGDLCIRKLQGRGMASRPVKPTEVPRFDAISKIIQSSDQSLTVFRMDTRKFGRSATQHMFEGRFSMDLAGYASLAGTLDRLHHTKISCILDASGKVLFGKYCSYCRRGVPAGYTRCPRCNKDDCLEVAE